MSVRTAQRQCPVNLAGKEVAIFHFWLTVHRQSRILHTERGMEGIQLGTLRLGPRQEGYEYCDIIAGRVLCR